MEFKNVEIPEGSWKLLEDQKMEFEFHIFDRLPNVTLNGAHIALIALTRVFVTSDEGQDGVDFIDLTGYVDTLVNDDCKFLPARIFRYDYKANEVYEWVANTAAEPQNKEEKQS